MYLCVTIEELVCILVPSLNLHTGSSAASPIQPALAAAILPKSLPLGSILDPRQGSCLFS